MYSYRNLQRDLEEIRTFSRTEVFTIGKSVMGKELWGIRVGDGTVRVQINAAHHALESITSALAINFCKEIASRQVVCGYNMEQVLQQTSYFIIPMVNPDGVELASDEIKKESMWYKRLHNDFPAMDFSKKWSANINGVDLNHNYDAGFFDQIPVLKREGIKYPGPTRYPGESAFDQPESRALGEFTAKNRFDILICLHAQGKEIYFDYNGFVPPGSYELSKRFAQVSGYRLSKPDGCACYGGCKDWFIDQFHKPGFTVEVGEGVNPLPDCDLAQIEEECFPIFLEAGLFETDVSDRV